MPLTARTIRSAAGLWLAGAVLLLALAPGAGAVTVDVRPLDPVAAARVPVVGGTAAETSAARKALAAVVHDVAVRRIVFGWREQQRSVVVVLAGGPAWRRGIDGAERDWLGRLIGENIAAARARAAHPVRWIELRPAGGAAPWGSPARPQRDAAGVAALGQTIVDRATASGWEVTSVRGWQLGPGAVSVGIRISELQFLTDNLDWVSTLLGDRWSAGAPTPPPRYDAMLAVQAADGTILELDGNAGSTLVVGSGVGGPGRSAPPDGLVGPTRLDIEMTILDDRGRSTLQRSVLDCDGGASVGVPDPPAACAELVRRRYSLLAFASTSCAGGPADTMQLEGTFLGTAVTRVYGICDGGFTAAWQELLGVPARAFVDLGGDPYVAAAVRIVGATATERRVMRRALAHVPASLPVARIVFGWDGRRRGFTLVPGSNGVRVRAFERRWLAEVAVEDLARRLRGAGLPVRWVGVGTVANARWPYLGERPRRRNAGATLTLTRELRQRAIDAGWLLRGAEGWRVGPGAVALTLRLTERQFLDGPTDWMRTLLGDRADPDHGYAAQLVIEAPDGKPVYVESDRGTSVRVLRGRTGRVVGSAPPPAGLTGPTRLELRFLRTTAAGPETADVVLDCAGGDSTGIPDPAAACAGLVADRYALLAPVPDMICDALVAGGLTVRGTFAGVAVTRDYTACDVATLRRWRALVGLPG